ncbi:sensor domain-containing diguanylate cyclase [Deinococcus gobiensis]|uniref:Diguanylate cyclase with GAF sensor n=1 Tax=Deinococcus gobiensis (strain DSM 21396 / JCM 16679 / CGMCC 1.7299 / I-0) TaxID=745776 RepID=H8GWM9_DEIGI|nr:sensor domain-containing diguanylate cyclase [Deinococcus gobiensis]AFD24499.1 Diguanylate cyclase with GAF sensor [Deinococcus gobiensis I-0]
MRTAPLPSDEAARLLDLARYDILDTPAEQAFDRITRLAARLLDVPMAILNFVDEGRHWGKATTGIPAYELPRADSPCAWTILQDTPLLVPDLSLDTRFQDLPAVQQGCRMYAGAPLSTPRGQHIGTLCVVDVTPRTLSESDLQVLQDLADVAMSELELRRHTEELERQVDAQTRHMAELQRDLVHAQTLEAITTFAEVSAAPEQLAQRAAELLGPAVAADWAGLVTVRCGRREVRQVHRRSDLPAELDRLEQSIEQGPRSVTATSAAGRRSLYVDRYPEHPDALPVAVEAGVQAGAWIPLGTWDQGGATLIVLRAGAEARRSPWRENDRALLEAAGRSVRAAIDRHETLQAATQASRQDALTGTGNRRALEDDLAAQEPGLPLTLALMDLDGFKALNDRAGHAEGDRALRLFAGNLRSAFAAEGQLYRLGGDEFVLLLPGTPPAEELRARIDLAGQQVGQTLGCPLGVSVGTATTQHDGHGDLLALADTRMYADKRRRKA